MYLISDGGLNCNSLDTIESVLLTKNIKRLDGVKLDVRLSQDKVFVISRYQELDKFSYSKGLINEYNYNYLRKIKFPSHIFKYYIPTLEEILKKYNYNKIIVLELYSISNLNNLFDLLSKYDYKYYFYSKDTNILNKLNNLSFDKLGFIINSNNIIKNDSNTFYISTN